MTIDERYDHIIGWFEVNRPEVQTELQYDSVFHLLVSVVLSAQCTDKRVNMVTPALFERFPDPASMAAVEAEEIFPYIKSISYPNNKARNLSSMARTLTERFGGVVPDDVEQLQQLAGVGRKTANVIVAVAFGKAAMPVDTHVFRVSARLGLTHDARTPRQTEDQLTAHIAPEQLSKAHHWLILHGRYVCTAIKPHCTECGLSEWCSYRQANSEVEKLEKIK